MPDVPWSRWITSLATSLVISPGLDESSKWTSPIRYCGQLNIPYHFCTFLRTLDDVCNSWAMAVYRDRLADVKFTDSRHQVVRFVGREAFVKPVDLKVFVVVMWTALESSPRNFDVL